MPKFSNTLIYLLLLACFACRSTYNPNQVFNNEQIKSDFAVLKKVLEAGHPSLYWYSPKDSIDAGFAKTLAQLDKPMTSLQFRRALEESVRLINCGHTGIYGPIAAEKYHKKNPRHTVPIGVVEQEGKIYISFHNSTDTTLKKGMELVSIEQHSAKNAYDTIFKYTNADGYNLTYKRFIANNYFGTYYTYWFGEKPSYSAVVRRADGKTFTVELKTPKTPKQKVKKVAVVAKKDSLAIAKPIPKVQKRLAGNDNINLKLYDKDTTIAILTQSSFGEGKYKAIYRKCFEIIAQKGIKHLVIDVRGNGGGKPTSTSNLASYLLDSAFVMHTDADAMPVNSAFNRYTNGRIVRAMLRFLLTAKKANGHFTHKNAIKTFSPDPKYPYRGKLYVLTNGGSFSAASIFPASMQAHKRGLIIGRETGGGAFGCTAWMIPYITLPATKVRLRLPLFRLYNAVPGPNMGRGVMPDYPVQYSLPDVLTNVDLDLEQVAKLKETLKQ